MVRSALLTAALFSLAACGDPVTEIVVVSDTTLAVPAGIDAVRFTVDARGIDGGRSSSTVDLTSARPATVGVVHRAGPLGPIFIEAEGLAGATTVLSRRARVTFVEGRVMMLRLDLDARCVGVSCAAESTCGSGGECRSVIHDLEDWTGQTPRLDGGGPEIDGGDRSDGGFDGGPDGGRPFDAGDCVSSPEVCDGADNDCNGTIDDVAELPNEAEHCGACGIDCGAAACVAAACEDAPTAMAAGREHTCALSGAGDVYCWGVNGNGQLGVGDTSERLSPTQVPSLTGVVALAAGDAHTCALLGDGSVYCWGAGGDGQVDGGTGDQHAPVMALAGASAITAGGRHTCAIRASDGSVECWGANDSLQLGDSGGPGPVAVPLPGAARDIAAGAEHTCAALAGGAVRCWGDADRAQITGVVSGTDMPPTEVIASGAVGIGAGHSHSCALLDGGAIHCWGGNGDGQLGQGTLTTPRPPGAVTGISDALWLGVGAYHTCAVRADGSAWCWGTDASWQLGDPTFGLGRSDTPRQVPGETSVHRIAAGELQSCTRRVNGSIACWGRAAPGNGTDESRAPVVATVP